MNQEPARMPGAVVAGEAPDLGLPSEVCLFQGRLDPCIIVIFGASGDLAARKLMPALYNLHLRQALPKPCCVLGAARTAWSREEFQNRMREAVAAAGTVDLSLWPEFAGALFYESLDYNSPEAYLKLGAVLEEHDRQYNIGGNRLFYLALPPSLYQPISLRLGKAGLGQEGMSGRGWSRIVVEKPFGHDLKSARELNASLHQSFPGAPDFPHRPLYGQGNRAEHPDFPVCQRHFRAALEPELH
jgi:glucose-6-phosphate 1-dehydrogenase